ncbi:DEAD/DEAH box helicase [Mediterraneibacter sp. NSJ-55]|uniref:DEAD/DEAH box helicase n=1 Tax=Mediterraneibacter hominis TaxID=2763054 RepID=A0A923RP55_9FIRM|nr:DEAD/DEAH box helicase [Mediterraneibacter hominis]MBC5688110.1 DEAD/DEAH box helicase [Mediterraneibacter hominis]
MIEIEVPVEKIPYIRTIEGRRFRDGHWFFPDSSAKILKQVGLIDSQFEIPEKQTSKYETSKFLRKYQADIVNEALNHEGYGIFMDTGTGKTITALEIAKHIGKTLVLCPLSVIETAWIDDCRKFYPEIKIINCWGNSQSKRIEALHAKVDVYVMNYDTYKILKNEIRKSDFQCMIVDESSVMKNMKSQITTDILSMIDVIPRRYVLSGTPNPNSNLELYPQMKFVLPDLFGNSYYGWQATYFHQDMANPHVWYQTQDDKDRLFARLSEGAVFLKKEDCVDLPPKVFEIKQFEMGKEQSLYYDNIMQDIKDNINQWSKFEFTAKLMKIREVFSGFVINKDATISTFKTNKEDLLKQTLEEIGDKQVIVWCQFTHEIESLSEKFKGVGLTSKTKNRDEIIREFKEGNIRLLFAHPKLLGKGVTFTKCTYNIYYSLSFSYEEYRQSQDRIHRIGQENKCTYIILQAKHTIDETKIYKCLERKENIVDELYLEMGLKVKEKEKNNG